MNGGLLGGDSRSAHVLPVPRLVVVGAEAEALGVPDEPLVDVGLDLQRAVRVLRLDRLAADVDVEGAAREVRAVDGEPRAARMRRSLAQPLLILARAEGGDDLEVLLG